MEYIFKTLSEICMENEKFQGQSTGYGNGCFSAVNRVNTCIQKIVILNVMGIRSSKYG